MAFLAALWGRISGKLLAGLALLGTVLVAILALFRKGEKAGEAKVVQKQQQATIESVKVANDAQAKVENLKPNEVQQQLQDKWSREG